VDLVYPPRCVACARFGRGLLCGECIASSPAATGPGRCPNCAAPWDKPDFCTSCLAWTHLDGARAAFEHTGAARRAVHGLKYERVRALAPLMAPHLVPLAAGTDLAFAVPLHRSRERQRGYNQAQELLRQAGLPRGEGVLTRVRKTKSQVGLALAERRSNVGGAFVYRGPELTGMRVLLIDDVITTGATADECARVLKDFGSREVRVLSFTRAAPPSASRPSGGDA
jgi:ComF family protein